MRGRLRALYKKAGYITASFVLALSTMAAAVPFILSQEVDALPGSEVVYNTIPEFAPLTQGYPSYGTEAHQQDEQGDKITLAGSNRLLDKVTFTLVDWAKYSTWSSDARYSGNSSTWSHPMTVTIYGSQLDAGGIPTTVLAQKTATVSIPWRPESDPSCGTTSNGTGWKVGDTCYNNSGVAANVTVDFSSSDLVLPETFLIGVKYDTQTRNGAIGQPGPYNSLNVALLQNDATVGTSDNLIWTDWDAEPGINGWDYNEWYGGGLRNYGFRVTATAYAGPTNVRVTRNGVDAANGATVDSSFVTGDVALNFDATSGADQYNTRVSYPNGDSPKILWNGFHNTWIVNNNTIMNGGFSQHGEGAYGYEVRSRDAATGKWSEWSAPVTLVYDNAKPVTQFTSGERSLAGSNFTVGYKITDTVAIKDFNVAVYQGSSQWKQNCATGRSVNVMLVEDSCEVRVADLPEGTYYLQVGAVDYAGHWSVADRFNFTVDHTAPAAPAIVNNSVFVRIGQQNKTLAWTHDGVGVKRYQYREYHNYAAAVADTPSWTKMIDAPALSTTDTASLTSTTLYWRVVAIDEAGNVSAPSDIGKITIDREAPVSTSDLGDLVRSDITVTQHITDNYSPVNGKIRIWKLDESGATDDTKYFALGYKNVDASGDIAYNIDTVAKLYGDGEYLAKFTAFDEAGNSSVIEKRFTVDNTPPAFAVPVITLQNGVRKPVFEGDQSTTGLSYLWTLMSGSETGVTMSDRTSLIPDFTFTEYGIYVFKLEITDLAGNTQTISPITYNYAAPAVLGAVDNNADKSDDGSPVGDNSGSGGSSNGDSSGTRQLAAYEVDNSSVLGATDEKDASDTGVAGVTDTAAQAANADDEQSGLWGLAWYWWLVIIAAVGILFWWIIAAIRGRKGSEA